MIVGTLHIRIHIPGANSLKEKRFVLKSLKDRMRRRFNISLSELDDKDLWQSADIAIAVVGDEKRHLNQILDQTLNFIAKDAQIEIIQSEMEFF